MHGSVVNRLMERSRYPEIVVGMGATVCMYSDRHPYTVVAIRYAKDGKVYEIDLLGDHVSNNKRVWPDQEYDITPSTLVGIAKVQTWRMDKSGRLRKTYINDNGRRVLEPKGSDGLVLGSRDYYQDPSF